MAINRIHNDDTDNIFIKDFPTAKLKEGIGAGEHTVLNKFCEFFDLGDAKIVMQTNKCIMDNIEFPVRRDNSLGWMGCCLFHLSILDNPSPDRPIPSVHVTAIEGLQFKIIESGVYPSMEQYQLNQGGKQFLTSGHYEYIKEQLEEALMGVGHTQLAPVLQLAVIPQSRVRQACKFREKVFKPWKRQGKMPIAVSRPAGSGGRV